MQKGEAKLKEKDDNEAMRQSKMISIYQCMNTMVSANQYASKRLDCSRCCRVSADPACFGADRSAVKANS